MANPTAATALQKKFLIDFGGGTNYYAGVRGVKDNESPNSINIDFKGTGSVGNRPGYIQVGTVTSSRTKIYGMGEYHTSSLDYAIKAASNGSNIQLGWSTGGSWTFDSGFSFTDSLNLDLVQANKLLYTFNGTDVMKSWDGTTFTSVTNGKILKYGAYYNNRLWGVDPTNQDTIWFSCQENATTHIGDFSTTSTTDGQGSGSIQFFPGGGARITAVHVFKDKLYVWLNGPLKGIFSVSPTGASNLFTTTMITNTIGCVSHRSVAQAENDIYFASDDGIYSLGAVQLYTDIRTTNKSLRMQSVFDSLSGASKQKLVGKYFNFKYHLFYPLFGGDNDSCIVFDIRYQGMQDWRNIAAQDASTYTDSTRTQHLYFGHPSTGAVYEMYKGTTDDGTPISSTWYSKSYDQGQADTEKLYFDTTYIFANVNGTLNLSVIFNDSQVSVTKALTQGNPQGGFGFSTFGRAVFGGNANTITVTQISTQPQRLHAKGKKFAIQYLISSTGSWTLNTITQTYSVLPHYAFPSNLKLN